MSLDLVEALALAPELAGWDGLGLAVQAYQKRALPLLDWLADLALRARRRLMVRLVKGAYWDTEIKRAQERGLDTYPVFTRKVATDVCYLACAKRMFAAGPAFYPQFATHNAHTVAAILEMGGDRTDWEYQRLHGMGEALYAEIVGRDKPGRPCRVYAPVGSHEDLLAYLVRRLLENGANTSFVNRLVDEREPIDEIIADPVARLARLPHKPHPAIPLPRDIFQPARGNSQGIDLADPRSLSELRSGLAAAARRPWTRRADRRRHRADRNGGAGFRSRRPPSGAGQGLECGAGCGRARARARRGGSAGVGSHSRRRRGQRRWSVRPTATSATGPS